MTMRTVATVFVRLAAELGQGYRPLVRTGGGQDLFRDVRVGSGYPGGHRPQVGAHQRGRVEVAAQVVAGLGGPERTVLDTLVGDGESERVGASDGRRRVLASVDRRPAERRGDPADALRVEHVHGTAARPRRDGEGEHVGLGGGGDYRPWVGQDHVGQERGLEGSRRRHQQQVLFQRDPQAVPVVGPAEEHRMRVRVEEPQPEGKGATDPAGAAQRCEAAPVQPQAEDRGEAFAGVQPQVQPESQGSGAVTRQVPCGQERPGNERGHGEQDG